MTFEIGYRRPPPKSRFTKGKSGNPKGRPKGSSNFLKELDKALNQSIVVTENGKKKKVTRLQAVVMRLVAGALQGEQRALLNLVEVLRRTGKFDEIEPDSLLPDDFADALDAYVTGRQKTSAKPTE